MLPEFYTHRATKVSFSLPNFQIYAEVGDT